MRHEAVVAQRANEADFVVAVAAQVGRGPASLPQCFDVAAAHEAQAPLLIHRQIAKFHPAILHGLGCPRMDPFMRPLCMVNEVAEIS